MDKKKAHPNAGSKYSQTNSNSASHQRIRLLSYLKEHQKITTLEARYYLDILMPAARIFELREKGENIKTYWRRGTTPEGKPHTVAEYVLELTSK